MSFAETCPLEYEDANEGKAADLKEEVTETVKYIRNANANLNLFSLPDQTWFSIYFVLVEQIFIELRLRLLRCKETTLVMDRYQEFIHLIDQFYHEKEVRRITFPSLIV